MKLVQQSFEILEQEFPVRKLSDNEGSYKLRKLDSVFKQIELAGRTCYKSTDKINDESAEPFVTRMIASQHFAMLEHGTIYLKLRISPGEQDKTLMCVDFMRNPFSKVNTVKVSETDIMAYITTNYRVIIENNWQNTLEHLSEPTEFHEKRISVRLVTNRAILAEFTRHRSMSFAVESTRYCNYTKEKFGNELTFIYPCWLPDGDNGELAENDILGVFKKIEDCYFKLINTRMWKPQQAATILPNALKVEMIMTGFISDWEHFFDLRSRGTTGKPHPQAEEIARKIEDSFKNKGYI